MTQEISNVKRLVSALAAKAAKQLLVVTLNLLADFTGLPQGGAAGRAGSGVGWRGGRARGLDRFQFATFLFSHSIAR